MNANKKIAELYDEINKLRSVPPPLIRVNDDDQTIVNNKYIGGFTPKGARKFARMIPVIEVTDAVLQCRPAEKG